MNGRHAWTVPRTRRSGIEGLGKRGQIMGRPAVQLSRRTAIAGGSRNGATMYSAVTVVPGTVALQVSRKGSKTPFAGGPSSCSPTIHSRTWMRTSLSSTGSAHESNAASPTTTQVNGEWSFSSSLRPTGRRGPQHHQRCHLLRGRRASLEPSGALRRRSPNPGRDLAIVQTHLAHTQAIATATIDRDIPTGRSGRRLPGDQG